MCFGQWSGRNTHERACPPPFERPRPTTSRSLRKSSTSAKSANHVSGTPHSTLAASVCSLSIHILACDCLQLRQSRSARPIAMRRPLCRHGSCGSCAPRQSASAGCCYLTSPCPVTCFHTNSLRYFHIYVNSQLSPPSSGNLLHLLLPCLSQQLRLARLMLPCMHSA